MYKLQVTADKLNIRNTPDADPTFANWVGDLNKDESFTATKLIKGDIYEGSDLWFGDDSNRFVTAAPTLIQQWWQALLRIQDLQVLAMPFITPNNPINIAVLDTGLISDDDIQTAFNIIGKKNFVTNANDVIDNDGHGTLCSALLSAHHPLFKGINTKTNLFIGKIYDDDGITSGKIITDAIKFFLDPVNNLNIDIISMSGGAFDAFEKTEIEILKNCFDHNIIFVCSCGNKGQTKDEGGFYPSPYPLVLSIGALNEQLEFDLNINPPSCQKIDFCIPGENVHSLNLLSVINEFNGTSQSCAIMSGIISLVLFKVKSKNLKWKTSDVKVFFESCSDTFSVAINSTDTLMHKINPEKLINNFKTL